MLAARTRLASWTVCPKGILAQLAQYSQRLHSHPFLLLFMLAPPCVISVTHSSPTLPPLVFLRPLREGMSGAEGTFSGPRLGREDYLMPRLLRAALAQSSPRRRGYTHDTSSTRHRASTSAVQCCGLLLDPSGCGKWRGAARRHAAAEVDELVAQRGAQVSARTMSPTAATMFVRSIVSPVRTPRKASGTAPDGGAAAFGRADRSSGRPPLWKTAGRSSPEEIGPDPTLAGEREQVS